MQRRSGTGTTQSGTDTHWQKRTGIGTSPSGIGTGPSGIGTGPSGTSTGPSGTGTDASNNLVFAYYAPLSLVFVHLLFRDPNKGLMGVHIRKYERENVLYLAAMAKRNLFSTINC